MIELDYSETLYGDKLKQRMAAAGYSSVEVAVVGSKFQIRAKNPNNEEIGNADRLAIQSMARASEADSINDAKKQAEHRAAVAALIEKLKGIAPLTPSDIRLALRDLYGVV